jgi:hypothetical protein
MKGGDGGDNWLSKVTDDRQQKTGTPLPLDQYKVDVALPSEFVEKGKAIKAHLQGLNSIDAFINLIKKIKSNASIEQEDFEPSRASLKFMMGVENELRTANSIQDLEDTNQFPLYIWYLRNSAPD